MQFILGDEAAGLLMGTSQPRDDGHQQEIRPPEQRAESSGRGKEGVAGGASPPNGGEGEWGGGEEAREAEMGCGASTAVGSGITAPAKKETLSGKTAVKMADATSPVKQTRSSGKPEAAATAAPVGAKGGASSPRTQQHVSHNSSIPIDLEKKADKEEEKQTKLAKEKTAAEEKERLRKIDEKKTEMDTRTYLVYARTARARPQTHPCLYARTLKELT